MSPEQFMDKRRNKAFTATEIMYVLHELRYCFKLMDTCLEHNPGYGIKIGWRKGQKTKFIESLKERGIPNHFAYVKFYADKTYKEGVDEPTNHIFALEAGKTSYHDMYKTDVLFSEKVKDGLARKWLYANKEKYLWYLEKILIVWLPLPEEEPDETSLRAFSFSVESDIGGLFGLFSS